MPEEQIAGESSPEGEPQKTVSEEQSFQSPEMEEAPDLAMEKPEIPAEQTEGKYSELLFKVSGSQSAKTDSDDDIKMDAVSIADTLDEESKIQKLLDLAEAKGVVHAVKVARSLKDYYALDKMHDDLADKLYEGFVERGMIEGK